MPSIFSKPAAENDLIELWAYIARDNPEAADRVYQAIQKTFKSLVTIPEMGTLYQSRRIKLSGIRFFPVKKYPNYVVYYREFDGGITIIRVLHTRMIKGKRLEE
jgi:toxin ParE1/3/4